MKKYIELTTTSNKTLFSFGCENNSFAKLLSKHIVIKYHFTVLI